MTVRLILLLILAAALRSPAAAAEPPVDYLTQVKPILQHRCYACHSALRQQSGLRLDTARLAKNGGDSGAGIEPGDSAASMLVHMITGELGVRMPPEEEGPGIKDAEIALIRRWIDEGANAPDEPEPPDPRDHWSYQPPVRPPVPAVHNAAWVRNPIDAFLAAQHEAQGLVPAAAADRSTLLRRVYLDLTGLPPTHAERDAFLADPSPEAYEHVVERLLESPQYGERWARHWMDVWRYSDWSGYKEEIRTSARHIWRWRDWIVESLNVDKGYDRMVVEMLAGDELAPTDAAVLPATGFLVRNWYKFNRNTWLDGTIEHTAKAFLGVTLNCCRCHDHKFDPISQQEYYRFRACFEPHEVRTDRVPGEFDVLKDGVARVCDAKPEEPTWLFTRGDEKRPDKDRAIEPGVPSLLGGEFHVAPIDLPLAAYYPALEPFAIEEDLARSAGNVAAHEKLAAEAAAAGAPLAVARLAVARAADASLRARIDVEKAKYGATKDADLTALAKTAAAAERQLAICQAQEQQLAAWQELVRAKQAVGAGEATAIQATAIAEAETKHAAAAAAVESAYAAAAKPGDAYQPLAPLYPKTSTGRRLALARWIVDRRNPLAARVAVNHIWLRHFSAPLAASAFDFGLRTPPPEHQALLDWLAVELMDHGWSMKHIHRFIVTSNAYRMSSSASADEAASNVQLDPDNRFLWRMNPRRLEAEAVRDSILSVADNLDTALGGPELPYADGQKSRRRSIYFCHAEEKQMTFLMAFDGPSVNECYRRSESVVPQQALALANSEIALDQSRLLAGQLTDQIANDADSQAVFIHRAFEQTLSREPRTDEVKECVAFLTAQSQLLAVADKLTPFTGGLDSAVPPSTDAAQRARENLIHALLNHNDFVTIR